jgi:hypothetical protein
MILDRFPEARGLAIPAVVEHMRSQVRPEAAGSFWERLFPGQLPGTHARFPITQRDATALAHR